MNIYFHLVEIILYFQVVAMLNYFQNVLILYTYAVWTVCWKTSGWNLIKINCCFYFVFSLNFSDFFSFHFPLLKSCIKLIWSTLSHEQQHLIVCRLEQLKLWPFLFQNCNNNHLHLASFIVRTFCSYKWIWIGCLLWLITSEV